MTDSYCISSYMLGVFEPQDHSGPDEIADRGTANALTFLALYFQF